MRVFRPLSPGLARPLSVAVVAAWVAQMGVLLHRSYLRPPVALAADFARYGSSAQWRGIYYRGDKVGFAVGQTLPKDGGYELTEDGRLTMTLLGAPATVALATRVQVDEAFSLRRFSFSLDPGTGPTVVSGSLDGLRLALSVRTSSGERTEVRDLSEKPVLSLNLPRRLAARGLAAGQRLEVSLFDPATLRNAPMELQVQAREIVMVAGRPVPAFRVESRFNGISGRTWVTDVGEVVREESPTGLLVVRESAERAQSLAISGSVQSDLLETAAIVPEGGRRIDEPTAVRRLRVRVTELEGLDARDLEGGYQQRLPGGDLELVDPRILAASAPDPEAPRYLAPEPFLESDDPEVVAEARRAAGDEATARTRAERLVRHVHAILEKKPTVSLPSAREVLKTRVGDCNEHTALYVAMARALGLPARIAVGLVSLHGAFYYHAWPEVYVSEAEGARGIWLPVDPTLNQFPADATHLRLARGGLDRQAAILGLIGRARLRIVSLELQPDAVPVLVGRAENTAPPPLVGLPAGGAPGRGCWDWLRRVPLFQ